LLFARARFGRFASRASSVLDRRVAGAKPSRWFGLGDVSRRPGCGPSARPLFMSALVEPSRDASRPLASVVTVRHRASAPSPTSSQGPAGCSRAHEVRFTERSGSSHRLPAERSHLLCREKMEERPGAPSVVSKPLPASADPRGVSAAHTRRLATSNRTTRRAVPVTFGHDACAPFGSGAAVTQRLRGVTHAPCGSRFPPPLATHPGWR